MEEIKDEIYRILEQDASIQGHTGCVLGGDTRIYFEWPPEMVSFSAATPAYITLDFSDPAPMDMASYVQPVQYPDEIVEINVWVDPNNAAETLRDQIAERINVLFWQKKDTEIWTANIRVMHVIQEAQEDINEIHEGTGQIKYWRKYIRLRLEHIYKL